MSRHFMSIRCVTKQPTTSPRDAVLSSSYFPVTARVSEKKCKKKQKKSNNCLKDNSCALKHFALIEATGEKNLS